MKKNVIMLLKAVLIIAFAEFIIMLLFSLVDHQLNQALEIILDSLILSLVTVPVIYILVIEPHMKEEKKLSTELTKTNHLLHQLYDSADAIVAIIESDGTMSMINKYGQNLTGYSDKEIASVPFFWFDKFIPSDIRPDIKAIINSMQTTEDEFISRKINAWIDKDGNERLFEWSNSLIVNEINSGIAKLVTIGIDITDRINSERITQENNRLSIEKSIADEANKSKSEFLANMSHEIRTPMNGLLGFVEQLEKNEKDPDRLKQFSIIRNSGKTLLSIINDILDFSKLESGKLLIEKVPCNLNEIIESSIDIFKSLSSAKNINLHSIINESLPSCILGDQTRLKQVIYNLMGNALKFTKEGGNISLQARYDINDKLLHIAIIDTGIGIAKANLEGIFEAFSQEDASTTRKFGGTGLGLTISSRLVSMMGGKLKVQSKVGKGSKFYFDIPIETCSETFNHNTKELLEELSKEAVLQGHVLIVEDNKTNQMLMKMILDDHGLTYDIANDGAEAVLSYKLHHYEIILMDENMPNMNGIEATNIIRDIEKAESLSKIPIIAVTANAMAEDRQRFIDAGMNDYISKPYSEVDIVKILQKYL